jgi:tryptophan synthase beta chain
MGLEAKAQLEALGEYPTVVVGSLGAGSNFGGIAAPFLADRFHGRGQARCLSVEPAACPKMTRGVYAYDYTDSLGISPLQKMYTLGHKFATAGIHAGGLRYHAASKLVSALYDHKLVEAEAYQQRDIFESSVLLARTEDLLPAPESAHAVHAGILEAKRARERGTPSVILISVSGHGHYDMSAYESYLGGAMEDIHVSDGEIAASLESLPRV